MTKDAVVFVEFVSVIRVVKGRTTERCITAKKSGGTRAVRDGRSSTQILGGPVRNCPQPPLPLVLMSSGASISSHIGAHKGAGKGGGESDGY